MIFFHLIISFDHIATRHTTFPSNIQVDKLICFSCTMLLDTLFRIDGVCKLRAIIDFGVLHTADNIELASVCAMYIYLHVYIHYIYIYTYICIRRYVVTVSRYRNPLIVSYCANCIRFQVRGGQPLPPVVICRCCFADTTSQANDAAPTRVIEPTTGGC